MDAAISKKKRTLKKLETKFAGMAAGGGTQAPQVDNTFSTNISINNCDDGMSPLMTKFNSKKKK